MKNNSKYFIAGLLLIYVGNMFVFFLSVNGCFGYEGTSQLFTAVCWLSNIVAGHPGFVQRKLNTHIINIVNIPI